MYCTYTCMYLVYLLTTVHVCTCAWLCTCTCKYVCMWLGGEGQEKEGGIGREMLRKGYKERERER